MIGLCKAAKLRPPEFRQEMEQFIQTLWRPKVGDDEPPGDQAGTKSGLSRDQVEILVKCRAERALTELMKVAGRTNRTKFRDQVLRPLLDGELIEMTIPDKPRSSQQKYRLTEKGLNVCEEHR